jgi:hypothetical protein
MHSKAMTGRQGLATFITDVGLDLIMNSTDMVKKIVASRKPFATGCTIMLANV